MAELNSPIPNAIGAFQIGVSPIGTQPDWNYENSVISQYANSPIITTLIGNWFAYIDQTQNIDDFFDLMFNVNSAQGYGLDVWGRIVGVGRVLQISTGSFFGMTGPAGASGDPYSVSPFYAGSGATSNYSMTDMVYRQVILAKALANICDGSIPGINNVLLNLFPGAGEAYVVDGQNMTLTYTFNFTASVVQQAIVQQSGVLPTPCGVAINYVFN